MKLFNYYSLLICLITLSPAFSRAAEVITTQDLNAMAVAETLTFSNSNKIGTTDFVNYTCSGGTAKFDVYNSLINICLTGSSAKVQTSEIEDLKAVAFRYSPTNVADMTFSYSTDGSTFTTLAADASSIAGKRVYILPTTGKYYIRISRGSTDFYIREMQFTTEAPCNCLKVELQ